MAVFARLLRISKEWTGIESTGEGPQRVMAKSKSTPKSKPMVAAAPVATPVVASASTPAASTAPMMIEANHLSKQFGSFLAVRDISFRIPKGEVVAFLGPNGAGKSTTMRLLTGFIAPTKGSARIAGIDVQDDRIAVAEKVGYLPENGPLYPDMTPVGLLKFFGSARGLNRATLNQRLEAVLAQCSLETVAHKPIGKLSKGYRQRVSMAQALLHDPEVLILDEPTSGLDPNQIRGVRTLIRELGKSKTVLVSTHILQEVEPIASRVLFIHDGTIVFDGKPEDMRVGGTTLEDQFHKLTAKAV